MDFDDQIESLSKLELDYLAFDAIVWVSVFLLDFRIFIPMFTNKIPLFDKNEWEKPNNMFESYN